MPSSLYLRPRLSDLLQQRDIRLGVVGGHINASVTEDEACLIQGHAIPQHLRSCCVAKQMRTFGGSINVGAFESVLHHGGDPISGGKGSVWGVASNKDMIGINVAGPAFQIAEQSVADILREWQPHLVSPFPRYLQCAVVPVDVSETETRHISGAQT
jgi:hypothetical protein